MPLKADQQSKLFDVLVIGGGYAGASVAMELVRQSDDNISVALIERSGKFGAGVAYGTTHPEHLLNVPIKKMSAFADESDHFLNWAKEHISDFDGDNLGDAYVPRMTYAKYLTDTLSVYKNQIEFIEAEALDLDISDESVTCFCTQDIKINAKKAVWSLGNFSPANPYLGEGSESLYGDHRYIANPWKSDAIYTLDEDADVTFIGTGLTAIDMIMSLYARGHKGKITALSRRGVMSQPHKPHEPQRDFVAEDSLIGCSLRQLMRAMRKEVKSLGCPDRDWRGVTNSIRPHTQALWAAFNLEDKNRFLRHVRPVWDSHRHRIALQSVENLDEMKARGQLKVIAAKGQTVDITQDKIELAYRLRGTDEVQSHTADLVVNCTGPARRYTKNKAPLIQNTLKKGYITEHETGMGLVCDAEGRICKNLYTLGISRVGELWESKTVGDTRVQAHRLAPVILQNLL